MPLPSNFLVLVLVDDDDEASLLRLPLPLVATAKRVREGLDTIWQREEVNDTQWVRT